MLKKTFETLKKHPIIILLFALPLVYEFGESLLTSRGALVDGMFVKIINSFAEGNAFDTFAFLLWLLKAACVIGWIFLLSPAFQYYVYEAAADKLSGGWYRRGVKRCWWRPFVFGLICGLCLMVVYVPVSYVAIIISMAAESTAVMIISFSIVAILAMVVSVFVYAGVAGIIAEEKFNDGLFNMFKVGGKYYFKILGVSLLFTIPVGISFIVGYKNPDALTNAFALAINAVSVVCGAIVTVYTMHCYLDFKENEEADAEVADETEITEQA